MTAMQKKVFLNGGILQAFLAYSPDRSHVSFLAFVLMGKAITD